MAPLILAVLLVLPATAGETPAPAPRRAVLSAVGDIRLDGPVAAVARRDGPAGPTADAARDLAADIVFGNLETPVTSRGVKTAKTWNFRASPSLLAVVEKAGFTVLNLANNHVWDYGEEGFLDTLKHLAQGPWSVVGGGKDRAEAEAVRVVTAPSGLRVGFVGLTSTHPKEGWAGPRKPGVAFSDFPRVSSVVKAAKARCDTLVVSFHGGTELSEVPNDIQKAVARAAVDAGADLFLGHHPHVLQPVELYKGAPIVYSLGNFLFVSPSSGTHRTVIARAELEPGRVASLTFLPYDTAGGRPRPASLEDSRAAYESLDRFGAFAASAGRLSFGRPE